jgi:predicted RNA methylase
MEWQMIETTTNAGLHEFVTQQVLVRYARPGTGAADLGTGPGAMAARLQALGCNVVAVDRDANGYQAGLPHLATFAQADCVDRPAQRDAA